MTTAQVWRPALAVAFGLGLGFGLYQLTIMGFDADAYWNAALRLREGGPLYIDGPSNDPTVYRYPPWFAVLWTPLTFLPYELVMGLWRGGMVLAALALIPLVRSPILLALFVPPLLTAGWMGNVQPLVVLLACLGPAGIGVATGLKGAPLVAAVPYLLRRDWRRLALVVAVAGVLWAPLLLFSGYPSVRGFWPTDLAVLLAISRYKTPPPKHRGTRYLVRR